jgi:hypothetical protein
LIQATGTLAGKFKLQSTGRWSWDEAEVVASRWESADFCSAPTAPSPQAAMNTQKSASAVSKSFRVDIFAVMIAYLEKHTSSHISPSTLSKYRTLFGGKLTGFA